MPRCQVFTIDDALTEVVQDGLYMKSLAGESMSVAVVKFVEKAGSELPAKAHSHGEEASLQLLGSCTIYTDDPAQPGADVRMDAGDAVVIPAGLSHYGRNRFGSEGVSMRLNVVTPPRKEYGPEDSVPYYPLKSRKD